MKCENCGFETHPGDQKCINCGENLSLAHSLIPDIDNLLKDEKKEEKRKNRNFLFICIGAVSSLIALVVILLLLWLGR